MKQPQSTYQIEDAITPLDGRNRHKLDFLAAHFSDKILNKNRVYVEIEYVKALSLHKVIRSFTGKEMVYLDNIVRKFDNTSHKTLREIESITNHDAQAVIVYVQNLLRVSSLKDVGEMVHFGLTSEDVNNLAYALMIKEMMQDVLLKELKKVENFLKTMITSYKNTPMLGRTHGQSAAPTTFGKELAVYYSRLNHELSLLRNFKLHGKLNGNTGNFNAHELVFPQINWIAFSKSFISSFGFIPDSLTTQIEPYDSYVFLFQRLIHINHILNGLCKDIWMYAMLGYCDQKVVKKEVGSSALPHKINPIYFEGAEGGFGLANALLTFYADKLSYSRLQRDLSDSTVRRSFGIAFGYCLLSYQSVREGLNRVIPNSAKMVMDLNQHFEVLSEAVANILRVGGVQGGYQKAKNFFRGAKITQKSYLQFVEGLPIKKQDKKKLINLTPQTYVGLAEKLVHEK